MIRRVISQHMMLFIDELRLKSVLDGKVSLAGKEQM